LIQFGEKENVPLLTTLFASTSSQFNLHLSPLTLGTRAPLKSQLPTLPKPFFSPKIWLL